MNTISKYIISPDITVREAINIVDRTGRKAVCVCDNNSVLLGIFTDGDMRKYVMNNGDLSAPIDVAMNKSPVTFASKEMVNSERIQSKMMVYPIVDSEGILIDIIFEIDEAHSGKISEYLNDTPLVIMAGGKGTRLFPYTKILPKALIPIGEKAATERIIDSFVEYGCNQVFFLLNHKSNMIKSYFNDLDKDYKVEYEVEDDFLGTGGGLYLLKDKIDRTFFVSNCDVLLKADFECILRTHRKHKNLITFVCAMKNIVIPYGTINLDEDGKIDSMTEKPTVSFLTNTGVYVIEPEVISDIKPNEFIHLPDIAQRYMDKGYNIGVFPISEKSWMDMGQLEELEEMKKNLGVYGND